MRRLLQPVLVTCVSCGRFDFNAANAFEQLPVIPGGAAHDITRASDGTLYVLFEGSQVWKTADRGATWTSCGSPVITDIDRISVDPATGVLYTASDIDVLTSTDQCASWQPTGLDRKADYKVAVLGDDVLAGTDTGLWRRRVGAWSSVTTPADGAQVFWVATDAASQSVFLGSENGVARSLDGGATWTAANTGLVAGSQVTSLTIDPVRPAHVFAMTPTTFLSLDSGDHWASVGPSAAGVAIDPSAPDFVVLYNATASLVVSTDGGATFDTTDHRSSEMNRASIGGVVFEPQTSQAFVACARGVFTATDHGLQWTEIDTGLQAWTVGQIGVAATGEIYVPTGAGVMRSLDGGATWDRETSGLPQLRVNEIVIPPDEPNGVIAVGDTTISESANRGASFTTLFTAGAPDGNGVGRVRVAGSQIVAATRAGIVISDATRSTFTHYDVGSPTQQVTDVAVVDAGATQILAATVSAGIYYSATGGTQFMPASAGLGSSTVHALLVLDDGSVLAATEVGVYRAASAGGSWDPTSLSGVVVRDLLETNGRTFAATGAGVFSSVDGVQWEPVPGLEHREPTSLAAEPSGRLLVGTRGFGVFATRLP